jgi:hypothetical protein
MFKDARHMTAPPSLSRAAAAAGVPPRYRYWSGRSTRRYLFSEIDAESAPDFADGVAIASVAGRILWAGLAAELADAAAWLPRGALLSVHLLASSADERRRVVEDLRPADTIPLRLAA